MPDLKNAKVMPSTAQVPVVTMQEIFQRLVDQGHEVLGTFISEKLSRHLAVLRPGA